MQLYEVAKDGMITPSVVEYYQKIVEFVIQTVREELKKSQNQGATGSGATSGTAGGSSQVKTNQKLGRAGSGAEANSLVDNWPVTDEPKEFFKRLIKAFEHINFYNVLIL